ncbi:MAG: radical SAM protein [Nitrospirae bacterium]|nr:radical SAM protein [Nitrospirota bacterium]
MADLKPDIKPVAEPVAKPIAEPITEYVPYIVSWNLTGRCNLSCPHCYMDATKQSTDELSTEEIFRVMDELGRIGKMMLVLTGGEPMMREDVYDIVQHASQLGFIAVLGSNGTLLREEHLARLKDCGLRGIGVSIDSVEPAYHDSFRNFPGAWTLSVNSLRYAKSFGLETQVDVTITDENCGDLEKFIQLAVDLGAKAINFFFLVCTGRATKSFISTENYEATLHSIASLIMAENRIMVRARCAPHIYRIMHQAGMHIPAGTRGCLAGRAYMRIDNHGNVTPCPYMPTPLGNVRQTHLSGIWNGSGDLTTLRNGTYKGRCAACEYTEICGGCRARALAHSNDFMEEDSLCKYEPCGGKKVAVTEDFDAELVWDEDAGKRMKNIPAFMKHMIIGVIETKARKLGIKQITTQFIDGIKKQGYPKIHEKKPV